MSDRGAVQVERHGVVVAITFDRPQARNALTWAMYEQLDAALDRLDPDDGVRVAVLRGAGGTFASGTDIAQFRDFTSADDGLAYERQLETVVARLEAVRVPTVAVVEGVAAGAGLILAAACDLRVATPNARFGAPIARTVGNCLSLANTARLVAHLGSSRTAAMLLTTEFLGASEALRAGFLTAVVEPAELDAHVSALCDQLAAHAPVTLQVTKEAIRRLVATGAASGDDLVRRAYGSRDFREGVNAFLQKRAPRWEGR